MYCFLRSPPKVRRDLMNANVKKEKTNIPKKQKGRWTDEDEELNQN